MSHAPHLVLDGAVLAAEIVGATEVILCVKRGSAVQPMLERAIAEREACGYDTVPIRIVGAPNRYVSGEETAHRELAQRRRREADVRAAPTVREAESPGGRRWCRTSRRSPTWP